MTQPWRNPRIITARETINALKSDGFTLRSQSGIHQRYRHLDGRTVTVTFHARGQTFPPDPFRWMIRDQAKWKVLYLRKLGLL